MCSECGMTRCPSACPNAPEPEPEGECAVCGEPVDLMDGWYEFDGDLIHEECAGEYIKKFGIWRGG